jgi:hypothetical protein
VSGFVKIEPPLLKRSDFSLFLKHDTDSQGKERKKRFVLTSKTKENGTTSQYMRQQATLGDKEGSQGLIGERQRTVTRSDGREG